MPAAGISAVRYALPGPPVELQSLSDRGLLVSPRHVLEEFGFAHAYVSDRPGHELALDALRTLITDADLDPNSVDALFYAGALPESHQVPTGGEWLDGFNYPASRLQYECGLTRATVVGIGQAGCVGLMAAVTLAVDRLHAHPEARRVICVSADVLPPGARREIIYNVVSDGACAVLVERDAPRNRILANRRISKGYYWNSSASHNEIVAAYFPTARTIVQDTLQAAGLSPKDVTLVVPHNVSYRSWQILLPLVGIPLAKLFGDNIARIGHVIAADNFINLDAATVAGRLVPGDIALLFNFGFGANWATLLVQA